MVGWTRFICPQQLKYSLSFRPRVFLYLCNISVFSPPLTRIHARLLGPCYKTGLMEAFTVGLYFTVRQKSHPTPSRKKIQETIGQKTLGCPLTGLSDFNTFICCLCFLHQSQSPPPSSVCRKPRSLRIARLLPMRTQQCPNLTAPTPKVNSTLGHT